MLIIEIHVIITAMFIKYTLDNAMVTQENQNQNAKMSRQNQVANTKKWGQKLWTSRLERVWGIDGIPSNENE